MNIAIFYIYLRFCDTLTYPLLLRFPSSGGKKREKRKEEEGREGHRVPEKINSSGSLSDYNIRSLPLTAASLRLSQTSGVKVRRGREGEERKKRVTTAALGNNR